MAYSRPTKSDIDQWGERLGLAGWSWEDLAPYYSKAEKIEDGTLNTHDPNVVPLDPKVHGRNGAIHTSVNPYEAPIDVSVMRAFDETSGIPRPKDPWSGSHLGFYRSLFTVDRTGMPKRSYAANGYIEPILDRSNLRILTEAMALRLILDENKVAKGVEVLHEGTKHQVFAKKEVILSCGVVQSPQLLELSGIGAPEVLKATGIDCVVPLAEVGANLQEHPLAIMVYELRDGEFSVDSIFKDPALLQQHQKLLVEQNGGAFSGFMNIVGCVPYSSIVPEAALDETVAKIRSVPLGNGSATQKAQSDLTAERVRDPQSTAIQFVAAPCTFGSEGDYGNQSTLLQGAPPGRNACYSVIFSNQYVASRGSVHVQSSDPLTPPRIDIGYFSHPADADVLAGGASFIDRVFQSEHIREKIKERVRPGPEVDLQSREQASRYVQENTVTYNHSLGTCAMGQVVDERLHVKGVKDLRVVDASVFPMQISAHTLGTVYAVAEKAVDMIKQDFGI